MLVRLIAPDGHEIVGTKEWVPGSARVVGFHLHGERLEPEYEGETEVYWEGAYTDERDGEIVVIDTEGAEWTPSECRQEQIAETTA